MTKFIKLTVIEHRGHEVTQRTDTFLNSACIVTFEQEVESKGYFPRRTEIRLFDGGHLHVVEEARWIAQELGCKGRD